MAENIFETKEYKRARKAYAGQCTFEYLTMLLAADAFLATLLTHIGVSDSLTGIISSFVSLAFLFQLVSIFLAGKIKNVKKIATVFNCLSLVLFAFLYLIPFVPVGKGLKTALAMLAILFAYMSNYSVSNMIFKWANSFVSPKNRASYSAGKEIVSLVSGIVFSLFMGFITDKFAACGKTEEGFLFTAAVMLVLSALNFICLMMIRGEENSDKNEKVSLSDVLKNTAGNKNFRSVIVMSAIWNFGRFLTLGFLGTFKTKDLLISVGAVQVINIIGNAGRIFVSKPFGRFADRRSYAVAMRYAFLIGAAGYLAVALTTKATWQLIIVYTVLYNISLAGSNQNSFNIAYSYVDKKFVAQAMALRASVSGIVGFFASLLGGRILHIVQSHGNMILGFNILGQQLLGAISCIVMLATALYTHLVIEKQEIKIQ